MEHEHNKHEGHKTESFLQKFWIVLALTIPILAYSELPQKFFRLNAPKFLGSEIVILLLGSIVFFYGGWIFIAGAWRELKARLPGMMTLISLAITTAYAFSVFAVLRELEHTLFWELSTLIAVMLLGHWIEMRAVAGAEGALKELAKLLPDTAEVIRGNSIQIIPITELKTGDIVSVKPGGKVPADGKIIEGRSELNESIITGESKPVSKSVNDKVIAGSINGDGTLKVSVIQIGESTFLAGVMRLVAEAQSTKSRLQMLSDRAAFYLTILAIGAGGITFILWLASDAGVVFAVERLVAVLVIACPHALGLAIPLVASISTTMAAQNGLLIRERLALEAARKINIVLFDKTGTLTDGFFSVVSYSSDEALRFAASVDAHSEHPIARGIVAEAKKRGLDTRESKNFRRIPGVGGEAEVDGQRVFVGHRGEADIMVEARGKTIGIIKVADKVRPEAKEALRQLRGMNIKLAMITGDSEDVAKEVGEELGIDEYLARVLPHQKSEKVKGLQNRGLKVAMVGDGVNDAPALTQADLGIAIGAGTNVAIESAGIILVRSDPRDIPKIIKLSQITYSKMIQNLFWATAYNVVALPIAAGALASKGIILEPAVAAIFMSLSTVIVAFNAVLLRRQKI